MGKALARPSRDSLASGGPIQSLPRFASTAAAESKISSSSAASPAAKSDITLNSHGKLQFGKGLPEALTTLLQQTIGKNSQPFVAHHENQDTQQHALVDKSGRLFVIQSNGDQHIALHSSGRSAMPTGKSSAGSVKLESTPEHLSLQTKAGKSTNVPLSGRMNHELLTGIHRQPDSASGAGEQLRLHDGKLLR